MSIKLPLFPHLAKRVSFVFCSGVLIFLTTNCSSDPNTNGDGDGGSPMLPPATGGLSGATGGASPGTGGASSTGGSIENTGGLSDTGGVANTGGGTGGTSEGTGGDTGQPVVCPTPALSSGDETRTITVGGKSRTFILHVPAAYTGSEPKPLIVDFHPLGGSGMSQRGGSPYPAQVDAEGVIMAFPSGMSGPSGGAWNVGPCCVSGVDDVEFARALVADIQKDACIDPKRIYATGFSMGGGMSHYLACHAADLFAAVAPAAFDLLEENVTTCNPARPIPVVAFRGTSDGVVPYNGGYSAVVSGMPITFLGATDTQKSWADMNGCTGTAAPFGTGCTQYSTCDAGVSVTLCTKQGGGHDQGDASVAWPLLKTFTLP